MLKQIFHKIASVTMAILLLLSTVSFTVEKHFCGDVLIDVAVLGDVEKCAMEAFEIEQEQITKKSCCKDTLDVVEGQNQLTVKSFDDLEFEQQLFLSAYVQSFSKLFEALPLQVVPHQYYSPPKLIADICLLDQVFLI
ncbi:HYC_CC_PP family protein [Psychroserpens sp. MEBiC05023]